MATAFKQVKNNSRTLVATAPSPATSGTSLVVTAGKGALFNAPGNGFWATIWDSTLYADPTSDPNMEIVLVTARSTDTFTITRAQQGTAARTVAINDTIAELWTAQNVDDITAALNTAETTLALKSYFLADAVIAPSGGDYTTVTAAYTAGKRRMVIVGDVVETAQINIAATTVLFGLGAAKSTLTLPSDNTKTAIFNADDIVLRGIKLINPSTNLAASTDAWWNFNGNNILVQDNVFYGAATTGSTNGYMVNAGKQGTYSVAEFTFDNNLFTNNNSHAGLINYWPGSNTNGADRFTNNRVQATVTSCFFDFSNNSSFGDISGLVIEGNSGLASSHAASKAWINISNSTNQSGGILIRNNEFQINANSGGSFISVTAKNSTSLSVGDWSQITGNSSRPSAGFPTNQARAEIKVSGLPHTIISGNNVGIITLGSGDDRIVSNNQIAGQLTTSAAISNHVISGNYIDASGIGFGVNNVTASSITGNTTNGGAFDFSLCATCTIVGNNSVASGYLLGSSGRNNNTFTGNSGSTLTVDGVGQIVYGNYFSGAITQTSTDSVYNGLLYRKSSTTSTAANTSETDLATYTVGASRLGRDGECLRMEFSLTTAANTNTKQIKLYWAGSAGLDTTALILNGNNITGFIDVMRTGATTQAVTLSIVSDSNSLLPDTAKVVAGTATLSSTNIIKVTGTNGTASASDISLVMATVKYFPLV